MTLKIFLRTKLLVKTFLMLFNGFHWLFLWMYSLNGFGAVRMEHIFRTHTNRSSIGVSVRFMVSPVPEQRPTAKFQNWNFFKYNNLCVYYIIIKSLNNNKWLNQSQKLNHELVAKFEAFLRIWISNFLI